MKSWVKFGLGWGAFMFVTLNIIFPLIDGSSIELYRVLTGIPVWLVFGLIFGYVSRKKKPESKNIQNT
jgi:hypothetical protein